MRSHNLLGQESWLSHNIPSLGPLVSAAVLLENTLYPYCLVPRRTWNFIMKHVILTNYNTVKPHYNNVIGTMQITFFCKCYKILVPSGQNTKDYIKSCDHQNYLIITGFCYIWPVYNEVLLHLKNVWILGYFWVYCYWKL